MKVSNEDVIRASQMANTATEAAKMLGVKIDTYRKYALKLNCYRTNQGRKGISRQKEYSAKFNDCFFDTIDSHEKAYLLGYIAADGSICENSLSFHISRKDRCILEYICRCVEYDVSHISDYTSHYTDKNGDVHYFEASGLKLYSQHLVDSLEKYNIIPNKSHIDTNLFFGILDQYGTSWVAGYVDGDGSISKTTCYFSFVGNSQTICYVRDYLHQKFDISLGYTNHRTDILCEQKYCSKNDVIKLLSIYIFAATWHLPRKYESALYLMQFYVTYGTFNTKAKLPKSRAEKVLGLKDKSGVCIDCGVIILQSSVRCNKCASKHREGVKHINKPSREKLKEQLKFYKNFSKIGRLYQVSDNAIRKWCKSYNLPFRYSDIKFLSDNDWDNL